MEYKDYIIGFVLTLVVFVSVTTFLSGIAVNYGYSEGYMEDERIDLTGMSANLSKLEGDTQSWQNLFTSDDAFDTIKAIGEIALGSVVQIIFLIFAVPIAMFNLIAVGSIDVLGVPTLIIGVILDILIIGMIFAGWKLLRNP